MMSISLVYIYNTHHFDAAWNSKLCTFRTLVVKWLQMGKEKDRTELVNMFFVQFT